jgi:hypothetical protein
MPVNVRGRLVVLVSEIFLPNLDSTSYADRASSRMPEQVEAMTPRLSLDANLIQQRGIERIAAGDPDLPLFRPLGRIRNHPAQQAEPLTSWFCTSLYTYGKKVMAGLPVREPCSDGRREGYPNFFPFHQMAQQG